MRRCSIFYFKVHQGCLEGKKRSSEALLEGGWGGGSSLASRWCGIRFPNLWGISPRPLFLIVNLLYPFSLINWTLSPWWSEEGVWYSYARGISRWSLSSFGRQDPTLWEASIIIWRLGLDCWMEDCNVKDRLWCSFLCNSMYLLDYSNIISFHKHYYVDDV